MSIFDAVGKKFRSVVGEAEGTAGNEEFAGLMDPTPYEAYFSNGMFRGRNAGKNNRQSNIFLYFKFPEDVKVEWTSSYRESADNQSFLTDLFNSLGSQLINKSTRAKKDTRMRFHIPIIREVSNKIAKYDGITPAHSDFLDRFGGFDHPIWHAYFGVELQMGSINHDVFSVSDKVRNYIDYMTSAASEADYRLYRESMEAVTSACLDVGMRPLDFTAHPEDFYRLSAWFGEEDPAYDMKPDLATTPLSLPEHNKSIFVGGTEMTFSAVRPKQDRDIFDKNPLSSTGINFGKALLAPSMNLAHINIRGEIRSPESTGVLFDDRLTKGEYKEEIGADDSAKKSVAEKVKARKDMSRAEVVSEISGQMQFAWLDNVEITVARIVDGLPSELDKRLSPFGLESVNVVERQQIALSSTVPCYPNPIFKIPAKDKERNPNVNNFFAGVLSLSGLFRSTKPCGPGGILLGLSDSGYEFKEIFIEPDAAYRHSSPPTILLTGTTGSGKALPLDTKLKTPDGKYITMGDVKVGTKLVSPDGKATEVTYVTPVQENHPLTEMITSDGQSHTSDFNHQWIVRENVPEYRNGEQVSVVDRLLEFDDKLDSLREELLADKHELYYADSVISSQELYSVLAPLGAKESHFSNNKVIEASLDFVGVGSIPFGSNKSYNISEAITGIQERISQRISTVSWRDDDPQLTRLTSLEMLSMKMTQKPSSGRGSVIPRFSIPTTLPVSIKNPSRTEIDPLVAGFIISASPTKSKNGIEPKSDWALGDLTDKLSAIADRQTKAIQESGLEAEKGVFGTVIVSQEDIALLKKRVVDYDDNSCPHLLSEYKSMRKSDRIKFIQGLVDGCLTFNTAKQKFCIKIPSPLLNDVADIIRSMGVPAYISNKQSTISFFLHNIVAGNENPVENPEALEDTEHIVPIESISPCGYDDVKCIQVDNDYHAYLVEGYTPTSNTVEALMIAAQFRYIGQQVIYLNPKPKASLKPFFDMLGGQTISMSTAYLKENPGLLDPMFFLEDREAVARLLTDMIIRARRMTQDVGAQSSDAMETLGTEIMERAMMSANECSYDIIFGNERHGARTPRLTDDETVSFVRNKMARSPVWKATISQNPDEKSRFQKMFDSETPVLIEWDKSIVLPDESSNPDTWTIDEIDSIQSVINLFDYASDVIGNGRKGGLLAVDEAQVLRNSEVLMNKVKSAGAMWRQANINLLLATQNISTFADGESKHDISPFVRLFIMMKTNDKELKHFYRITGLPQDENHSRYMENAGVEKAGGRKKDIPNAFVFDRTYNWSGGIICGPFPNRELSAALSDKEGEEARKKAMEALEYQNLMQEDMNLEEDPEELQRRISEEENRTSFG